MKLPSNFGHATTAILAALLLHAALPAQDFSQTQTKPSPSAALIQQANDSLSAGDLPAALRVLTTLNAQTPNDPQVLYDLGLTLEAIGPDTPTNPQPTPDKPNPTPESLYRQSIAADPTFPAAHVALGLLLARTNRAPEAHAELLAATTLPTASPALKARAFRALARLDLSGITPNSPDPTAASADLLEALKLIPELPEDILLAAEIAEAVPDLPAAEAAYRRYLALNPEPPDTLQTTAALAHVLLAEHHAGDAETLLTAALAAHPADPTLTSQLAAAYLASNDDAKIALAAPLLESLHAAHPADTNVTRLLARVYVETNHPDRADPIYATLISAQSQNGNHPDPTLLDERAEALIRLHRPGEAETLLKLAIANPRAFPSPTDLAAAATHLAFAAAEIDDPRITLQALTLRATVLPPSSYTLFLEATANDTLHQSTQAVALYRRFLTEAAGTLPEQEQQARQRLAVLAPRK